MKLNLNNNNIGEEAADDIAAVLSNNTKLQELYLSDNNFRAGAIKIAKGLQNTTNLTILYLNNNIICEEAADDIAAVLFHNTKLQEFNLSDNNFRAGAIKIAKGLQNTTNLTILYFNNNNIGEEAADDIAAVLSHNTKLQHL